MMKRLMSMVKSAVGKAPRVRYAGQSKEERAEMLARAAEKRRRKAVKLAWHASFWPQNQVSK